MVMLLKSALLAFLATSVIATPVAFPQPELDAAPVRVSAEALVKRNGAFVTSIGVYQTTGLCDIPKSYMPLYGQAPNSNQLGGLNAGGNYCANGNINFGFGGQLVYLWLSYTNDIHQAMTNIWIVYSSSPNYNLGNDMAIGTGGLYRYVQWGTDTGRTDGPRITEVYLWRTSGAHNSPPAGYAGITSDINKGRHGDYVYIVWKIKG